MTIEYEKHNIEFFEDLYHPDLLFTISDGSVFSKDEILSYLKADSLSPNLTTNSSIKIIHRANFAYVNLIETFPKDEKYDEYSGRYSKVFIKENGNWNLIAEHITDLPKNITRIKLDSIAIKRFEGNFIDPEGKTYNALASSSTLIINVNNKQIPFLPYDTNKFYIENTNVTLEFLSFNDRISHLILRKANEANIVLVKE